MQVAEQPMDLHTGVYHVADGRGITLAGCEDHYEAVGFISGQTVRFVVCAANFYGRSEFSLPSEPVSVPEVRA